MGRRSCSRVSGVPKLAASMVVPGSGSRSVSESCQPSRPYWSKTPERRWGTTTSSEGSATMNIGSSSSRTRPRKRQGVVEVVDELRALRVDADEDLAKAIDAIGERLNHALPAAGGRAELVAGGGSARRGARVRPRPRRRRGAPRARAAAGGPSAARASGARCAQQLEAGEEQDRGEEEEDELERGLPWQVRDVREDADPGGHEGEPGVLPAGRPPSRRCRAAARRRRP